MQGGARSPFTLSSSPPPPLPPLLLLLLFCCCYCYFCCFRARLFSPALGRRVQLRALARRYMIDMGPCPQHCVIEAPISHVHHQGAKVALDYGVSLLHHDTIDYRARTRIALCGCLASMPLIRCPALALRNSANPDCTSKAC
ncbi:hypothetical protein F5B18DRAFT_558978 [Nemania serpens]|nr:hypothetical protein F5B18DRAFT_558978 [Nemania serpens]